jgi:MFS transporter, Spinster family, sphingosine-1-phosphate transporter
MATTDTARVTSSTRPLWPRASLIALTGLNLLDYLDRQILNASLPHVQSELGLDDTQGGMAMTAFMLGYFLTSPIFGYLGDRMPRRWLVGAGVVVWSIGTLFTGHVHWFVTLLLFRALVGFGEASFGTISPGWIADLFPKEKRNNAITIFYLAIPVGSALGFLYGGYMAENYGWRAAFQVAGYAGLVLALVLFFLPEPARGASDPDAGAAHAHHLPGWRSFLQLAKYPQYRLIQAGYIAQTFALGGFQVWAPTFLYRVHGMALGEADFFFGSSLAVSGLFATLLGGFAATKWQQRTGTGYASVLALSATLGAPLAFLAFTLPDLTMARAALVGAMFCVFMCTGPVNTMILETVPVAMRATAMAGSIFLIHAFGDLWSPTIVGRLSDQWGDLGKAVLVALPGALLVSAFFWIWLLIYVKRERAKTAAA